VPAELLGGVSVPGDLVTGGEERLRASPHPGQRGAGFGQVESFGGEFVVQ
jgi:hypothetical protein